MKTFDDLEFKVQPPGEDNMQAILFFPNGYGVSVLFGERFYSNGVNTYELAVIHKCKDGFFIMYNTGIADNVLAYITREEVTEAMQKVQQLKPINR